MFFNGAAFKRSAASLLPPDIHPLQPLADQSVSAAGTGIDGDGCHGAVFGAGAALDAGVRVGQARFGYFEGEDAVGADLQAAAATDAEIDIEAEGRDIFKVSKVSHRQAFQANAAQPQSSSAPLRAASIAGRAVRISFFTPDREVKGVLPVKLRA